MPPELFFPLPRVPVDPAELFNGSDRLIEANHLNGMAAVHEKRQEYVDAERLYEEALTIYEELFGTRHLTTALATRNLARILRIQGKIAEASLLEDHASDILSRRADGDEAKNMPFGGSSGFFELLGAVYTRPEEDELIAEADATQATEATHLEHPRTSEVPERQ